MAQRARRSAIVYLLASVAGLCGLIFLLVAAFIYMAVNLRYGALTTALSFGGVFLALAVLVLLTHRFSATARARRVKYRREHDMKAALSGAAIAALPTLLAKRGSIGGLVLPALAAAFAFAIYRENSRRHDRDDDVD